MSANNVKDKQFNKWHSRTWIMCMLCAIYLPLGILGAIALGYFNIDSAPWLPIYIGGCFAVITAYVGGEKYLDGQRAKNGNY